MIRAVAVTALVVMTITSSHGAEAVDFNRQIRPLLADACFQCHGPDTKSRKAELRLDSRDGLFRERGGVTVVVPGELEESELIRRVTSGDELERMPPAEAGRKLTQEEIALLRRWVREGAEWEQHWSLQPPGRPALPDVRDHSWPRGAIDYFVLSRLEREGLAPSPPASKTALIRRVTLDLTGLPPAPADVDAFLADRSPGAYDRVVDRLLASPRYGERMAWDWLDAARYADSNGYQGDPERTMWPWRDWVVGAMNANRPFDRFTVEQLAGDLLPEPTVEEIIATGFNRNHMHNGEGGRIPEETRVENVMDRVETTATVWLGATMTCARCHDHKYDPFTQREYYRLYAFFNNSSETGGGRSGQIPPVAKYATDEDRARRRELQARVDQRSEKVANAENRLLATADAEPEGQPIDASKLPDDLAEALGQPPERRSADVLGKLASRFEKGRPEYAKLLNDLKEAVAARSRFEKGLPRVMVMDEAKPRETRMLVKGTYNKPTGEPLTADVPAVLPPLPEDAPRNRLALARWLVDPAHPLTARVTVNRYWQTFFGRGLVKTVEDFGSQGERPSHPQLLDWLASEFVRSGWDVKRMHRLIVTSATYRQSSKVDRHAEPNLREIDPENRLLARGPRYRLPSWVLRDQALAASGLLAERIGGPPVKPYQPEGIWAEATFGKKKYVQDHGTKLYRRSVYIFWRRIVGPTMFFDTANRQTCTVKKSRTNTPLHALTLLNDVTYVEAARALAARALTQGGKTPADRIDYAFRRVTARHPEPVELDILESRLQELKREFTDDPEAAHNLLGVGESPRNESLDPAEHAAYTALCTLILNLDESLTKQ